MSNIDTFLKIDAKEKDAFSQQFNAAKGDKGGMITLTSEPLPTNGNDNSVFVVINGDTNTGPQGLNPAQSDVVNTFATATFGDRASYNETIQAARKTAAETAPKTQISTGYPECAPACLD